MPNDLSLCLCACDIQSSFPCFPPTPEVSLPDADLSLVPVDLPLTKVLLRRSISFKDDEGKTKIISPRSSSFSCRTKYYLSTAETKRSSIRIIRTSIKAAYLALREELEEGGEIRKCIDLSLLTYYDYYKH